MTVLDVPTAVAGQVLQTFAGTHRVQRVPKNDAGGRKHTSTATIAVLLDFVKKEVTVPDADFKIDRIRGHGRGGQRRNKVETAVRVTHVPTGTVVTRMSGRSQLTNIIDAKAEILERLSGATDKAASEKTNELRQTQTNTERSGKDFTHCWYRDEVVRHSDGHRWTIRQWKQGRLD